jgi:OOP family OmpA-OmpF porin
MSSSTHARPLAAAPVRTVSVGLARVLSLMAVAVFALPSPGHAQIIKKLKKAAKSAAERETENQIDRLISNAIKCVFDDPVCVEQAKADGQDVVLTDDEGNVLKDDEGAPITDPEEAARTVQDAGPTRPGEGVWANYDFVPGERVLFYDDYSDDNVGDFPRHLEFLRGNWELVEWQGRRLLRNTGPRGAALEVRLPEALPERFTIEFDAYFTHPNHQLVVATEPPKPGNRYQSLSGNFFQVGADHGSGVTTRDRAGVKSLNRTRDVSDHIVPFRIMVDGQYAKVYVGSQRVANVPNAQLARGQALYLENSYSASDKNPMYIGPIRVAAGGRDLYDVLAEEGRVATHGILFAVNSDRIRPESTPTLETIAGMLRDHPELRLSIEGHTDSDGEDAYNQDLSERRAAAVKAYLVEEAGIGADRLETIGYGESKPVADNTTPEGKQQNRRVELVKLGE